MMPVSSQQSVSGFVLTLPQVPGDAAQKPLYELVQISNLRKPISTRWQCWNEMSQMMATMTEEALWDLHPEGYTRDFHRQHLYVEDLLSEPQSFSLDQCREIDSQMMQMLHLFSGPNWSRHLLRYMIQDLMDGTIFVLDPQFYAARYNKYYSQNMLLFSASRKFHEALGRESKVTVSAEGRMVFINAVQYFEVFDRANTRVGFDALRVQIEINLEKLDKKTFVFTQETGTCTLMFRGFQEKMEEICF